jgi:hypothetical protein
MKKIILAPLYLLLGLVSFTQGSSTEKKSITENGITKSWIITKEFDAQGNLVDYDSTFSESGRPQKFKNHQDIFASPNFQIPNMDSLFTKMKADRSSIISEMNTMMKKMNVDSLLQDLQLSPEKQAPNQEEFNFPENQNGNKPKGTRT